MVKLWFKPRLVQPCSPHSVILNCFFRSEQKLVWDPSLFDLCPQSLSLAVSGAFLQMRKRHVSQNCLVPPRCSCKVRIVGQGGSGGGACPPSLLLWLRFISLKVRLSWLLPKVALLFGDNVDKNFKSSSWHIVDTREMVATIVMSEGKGCLNYWSCTDAWLFRSVYIDLQAS